MTLRWVAIALAALTLVGLGVTRLAPRIERVEVSGNEHLDASVVASRADVAPHDPFLWVTRWRVRELLTDPWVQRVRIVRHWPDTISIRVWERTPVLTDGVRSWAADGTELPGVPADRRAELPRLQGWGGERTSEALAVLELLPEAEIEVISYSPEGFVIDLADGVLMTPSPEALRDQWAAYRSQAGRRIAVYPWGVSSQHE